MTILPDPNPKRRLLMKSVSSAASGSGQQRVKRSSTDAEPEVQIGVLMEMGIGESAALPRTKNCCEVRASTPHHARSR